MSGDEFRQVVAAEKDRLHTVAAWLLHDVDEAQDVAQDALLKLWLHRDGVHRGAVRTWLLRTAHRACLDRLRRRARVMELPGSEWPDVPGGGDDAPGDLAGVRSVVGAALARLSPQQRATVVLREIAGMSYSEIGEVIGAPLSTVKVTLHRARETLRTRLASCVERR